MSQPLFSGHAAARIGISEMYLHVRTLSGCLGASLRRPLDGRHLLWVLNLSAAMLLVRTAVSVFRALDLVVYPGFREVAIPRPVLIAGNPRSGTTLLHRILALDDQFATARLYESVFPSLTLLTTLRIAGRIDRALGGHVRKLVDRAVGRSFSGWRGIHRTMLFEPEEDEQLFVYAMTSPVLALLFPFPEVLREVGYVDSLAERRRTRLMRYYLSCLKRQMYGREGKTLLVKSTAVTGRLASTLAQIPDMRIIHLIRHPYEAVASVLSMYQESWKRLVPQAVDDPRSYRILTHLFAGYYRHRMEVLDQLPDSLVCEVRYEDLTHDPLSSVQSIYHHFGLELTDGFVRRLAVASAKAASYRSRHRYTLADFGITRQEIYDLIPDVFERYDFAVGEQLGLRAGARSSAVMSGTAS